MHHSGFFIVANFKINMCLNPKNKALPWPKKTETERERDRQTDRQTEEQEDGQRWTYKGQNYRYKS